jgi:hypothetical protein
MSEMDTNGFDWSFSISANRAERKHDLGHADARPITDNHCADETNTIITGTGRAAAGR